MTNALISKLRLGANLSDEDCAAVLGATAEIRRVGPRTDLARQGETPEFVHGVLSGLTCRYKILHDGGRQIVGLLVPGDFCDLHVHILGTMDHTIATISPCEVAVLRRETVDELITTRPAVARALWWASLVDEATLREWLLSMGQRSALKQMAHLFCELRMRLGCVGLVKANGYDLPITQVELGDLLGLSTVHANRMLQELRAAGLLTLKGVRLQILDLSSLEELAEFDPAYLHLPMRRAVRPATS